MDAPTPDRGGTPDGHADQPLRSSFADDPEMRDLVEYFLTELDRRAEAVRTALGHGDVEQLHTIAHQLKGAAGGYGYPALGIAAAAVEQAIAEATCVDAQVNDRVLELLRLCEEALRAA